MTQTAVYTIGAVDPSTGIFDECAFGSDPSATEFDSEEAAVAELTNLLPHLSETPRYAAVARDGWPVRFLTDGNAGHHVAHGKSGSGDTEFSFDFDAIMDSLQALGATAEEAEALTDILDVEGWGGMEYADVPYCGVYDFTPEQLRAKLDWYRNERA